MACSTGQIGMGHVLSRGLEEQNAEYQRSLGSRVCMDRVMVKKDGVAYSPFNNYGSGQMTSKFALGAHDWWWRESNDLLCHNPAGPLLVGTIYLQGRCSPALMLHCYDRCWLKLQNQL